MSSTSTNGSRTAPAGSATSPLRTWSVKYPSLKFWLNQVERTIVSSAPESRTACSACSASGSPRPASSTSRRTPRRTASSANAPTVSTAPGTATSGK